MKSGKILSTILIASMLLGLATVFPTFATGTEGEVKIIDPVDLDTNFIFDTNNATGGVTTFNAEVWYYPNATPQNVKGWQVLIGFDATLLTCMSVSLPSGHIFDTYAFQNPPAVIDNVLGEVSSMAILISDTVNVSTSQLLCRIVFKIKLGATKADPFLSCNLIFKKINLSGGTYLINSTGTKLDITYYTSYYEMTWVPPSVNPYLEVAPPTNLVKATSVGQILDVPIWIRDCAAGWEQIGIQFELWYNSTLISFVGSGSSPSYDPGTFMEGFLGDSLGIFYVVKADFEGQVPVPPGAPAGENYFKVMILRLPNGSGIWNPPFCDGDGLIITLKIESLIQGMFPETLTCALDIQDVLFIDRDGNPLNQSAHIDGTYEITPKVLGRKIDIFTQYPYPYGGQGLYEPSDMFWPQKEVIIYANVTYNDWPEQFKDVAIQFIDPLGNTWAVVYGMTNETGIAEFHVRLPWPCDEWPNVIGKWTVIGTVDVACNIVNDTLEFKYDHLVNFVSLVPDKLEYKHCEDISVLVTFKSYVMQNHTIIVTLTGFDETGVPFDFSYAELTIGGAIWCQYKFYEVPLTIHCEKFARAGTGWLHVGALSDWPINGGDSLGIAIETPITILAEWAI